LYFGIIHSDNDYIKTTGITITAGRDINTYKYPADTMAVLLNETAVKQMGISNPVGQLLKNKDANWRIVGIVKDFITGSPYRPAEPIIIQGPKNWFGTVTFRLNGSRKASANIQAINRVMAKHNPNYPSPVLFVKDSHEDKFGGDRQTAKLALLFAVLSILISCMGLYALSTYMAEIRVKEIGIRKVLGASAASIITLISGQFLKLIVISLIVGSPVAWWMMNKWLQEYPYRVNLTWWIFILTGVISLIIAIVTIFHRSYQAATANPVRSLRSE
jgi:putative ABC transport system permease protein